MMLTSITESRPFRGFSFTVALIMGYAPCSLGFSAIGGSIGEKLKQFQREIHSPYTTAPGRAYLGKHPGRDPGRGVWSKEALANAKYSGSPVLASIDLAAQGIPPTHTLAVSPNPVRLIPGKAVRLP